MGCKGTIAIPVFDAFHEAGQKATMIEAPSGFRYAQEHSSRPPAQPRRNLPQSKDFLRLSSPHRPRAGSLYTQISSLARIESLLTRYATTSILFKNTQLVDDSSAFCPRQNQVSNQSRRPGAVTFAATIVKCTLRLDSSISKSRVSLGGNVLRWARLTCSRRPILETDSCDHDSSDNTGIAAIASYGDSVIRFFPRSEPEFEKVEAASLVPRED